MNGINLPPNGGAAPAITQTQARTAAGGGEGAQQQSFKQVWENIQTSMGAKPEKPREIKKTLDKDDFLRIMVTQMRHQDPTKPFEADKLATEMAQITSVEQLNNLNKTMGQLSQANRPLERLAMTNMIGKTVTIDKNRFQHAEGNPETVSFALTDDAAKVKVQFLSEAGEVLFEKNMGSLKKGMNTVQWDGQNKVSQPAKNGMIQIKVEAESDNGRQIRAESIFKGQIIGVSFQDKEPIFLIGNSKHQEKISLNNIVQVDDAGSAGALSQAPMQAAPLGLQPLHKSQDAKPPGFISFQKGVGSKTMDPSELPPELQAMVAQAGAQMGGNTPPKQEQAAKPAAAPTVERGFPNGMSDYNNVQNLNSEQKGGE